MIYGDPLQAEELRKFWANTRAFLETENFKHRRSGEKVRNHWKLFERLIHAFGRMIKCVGLYERGYRNATHVRVREINLHFEDLPEDFHNYRILHLTDLHLDSIPGCESILKEKLESVEADLCLITGDYREMTHGSFKQLLQPMEVVVQSIRCKDGIYATLGNHDSVLMMHPLEQMGLHMLANETVEIKRGECSILITGVDDPHYYFTDQAIYALDRSPGGFKIAAVHSPELADVAAGNGYDLYLCGHTHGGQICLPGGRPVVTHLHSGRRFIRGMWQLNHMTGYTSSGCGTSGIPIRFNTQSEIVLFQLKRA